MIVNLWAPPPSSTTLLLVEPTERRKVREIKTYTERQKHIKFNEKISFSFHFAHDEKKRKFFSRLSFPSSGWFSYTPSWTFGQCWDGMPKKQRKMLEAIWLENHKFIALRAVIRDEIRWECWPQTNKIESRNRPVAQLNDAHRFLDESQQKRSTRDNSRCHLLPFSTRKREQVTCYVIMEHWSEEIVINRWVEVKKLISKKASSSALHATTLNSSWSGWSRWMISELSLEHNRHNARRNTHGWVLLKVHSSTVQSDDCNFVLFIFKPKAEKAYFTAFIIISSF